jgi:sugar phosphate isomerase/epimerase
MGCKYLTPTFLFLMVTHLSLVAQPEPFAWCIVPFDIMERTPEQRIEMLKDLGINTYAYDWREKHLDEMTREFQLAKQNNISINAVWMWLEPKSDALDKLSPANEQVFQAIEKAGLETTLWVSFHPDFFKDLDNDAAVQRGTEMIYTVYQRCARIGCKLALYNHGDWFGDPANQIRIIKTLGRYDIGLVYSFHHAHDQIENFEELAKMMVPYLVAVNLNGMKTGGPQIYPLGQGEHEAKMIKILTDAGYEGPYGILGHKEEADVKMILEENLSGYRRLFSKK